MKRTVIVLCSLLCLAVVLLVIASLGSPGPNAPRFVPMHSQPVGTYTLTYYDCSPAVPIQNGRLWIYARSGFTNDQCLLYDVTNRVIVGELLSAAPILFNQDQTKLLCRDYSAAGSLKGKLIGWLETFPLGKRLAQKLNRPEVFSILDLKTGSARRVGQLSQIPDARGQFFASPGFRYSFSQPTTSPEDEGFLCDMEGNGFTKITVDGYIQGWWDAQNLLVKDRKSNFIMYNVATRRTNTLFTAAEPSGLLKRLDLPSDPVLLGTVPNWNGHDYDFYFTLDVAKRLGHSFLAKVDRATRTLNLVKRDFQFHHFGWLDAEGTHYLYGGEAAAPGSLGNDGAAHLRGLSDDSVRTLVEPDNGGRSAYARFCADGIIYIRNRQLFRVDLHGSNNAPLFQPGENR